MSRMQGANPDDLEATAARLASAAERLDAIQRRLNARLYSTPWRGSSADRFRHDWSARHRPQLIQASSFLRHGEARLRRNAVAQRQASSAEGGSLRRSGMGGHWTPPRTSALDAHIRGAFSAAGGAGMAAGVYSLSAAGVAAWANRAKGFGLLASRPFVEFGNLNSGRVFGPLSTGLGLASMAGNAYNVVTRRAWGDLGDGSATGLKMLGMRLRSKEVYMAGVNVALWTEVVRAYPAFEDAVLNWEPMPAPWSKGAWNDIYWQSAKDVGSELRGILPKAIL